MKEMGKRLRMDQENGERGRDQHARKKGWEKIIAKNTRNQERLTKGKGKNARERKNKIS